MLRHVAPVALALLLSACGAAPLQAPALRDAAALEALAHENIYTSKDIRYVCERMIARQADAKANKTNVARMGTALYHVNTLAKSQKQTAAAKIATKALADYHALCQAVKGNLTTKAAEEMKAVLMGAFEAVLEAMPPAEKPAKKPAKK